MTEPTQAEVDAIIDQMDAALALTISPHLCPVAPHRVAGPFVVGAAW